MLELFCCRCCCCTDVLLGFHLKLLCSSLMLLLFWSLVAFVLLPLFGLFDGLLWCSAIDTRAAAFVFISCELHECLVVPLFRGQVGRYFGFAQQVGLELGSLLPEGLRHTIAFVSVLVTMTLDLHKVSPNHNYLTRYRIPITLPGTVHRYPTTYYWYYQVPVEFGQLTSVLTYTSY